MKTLTHGLGTKKRRADPDTESQSTGLENAKSTEKTLEGLHGTEEQFRLLVNGVKDYAIFMLDPTGQVVSWNTGAERIKGYCAEEILGRHFSCFYPSEDIESGKPN